MQFLKQSTAATLKLGPFVDDADGKTAETSLTISQADVRLSKNGGDMAQKNNASAATHDELGYYDVPLNTTDTDTLGRLKVMVSESGALPVWAEFMVLPAMIYDSLIGGSDRLDVNVTHVGDTAQTAGDVAALLGTLSGYVDTEVAAIKAKTDNLPSDPADASDIAASLASLASTLTTIASYIDTEVAAILAAVDTEVGAIKAKTDNLPASPAAVGSAMTLAAGAIDTGTFAAGAIDAAAIAPDAIGASEIAAAAASEIASAVIAAGVTPPTVDGVTWAEFVRCVCAVLFGKTTRAANVRTFVGPDGATDAVEVTFGETPGDRTASTIL